MLTSARRAVAGQLRSFALDESAARPAVLAAIKRLGELGLTGDLLLRGGDDRGLTWLREAWAMLGEGGALASRVERLPILISVYPPFARHGMRNRALDDMACVPRWRSSVPPATAAVVNHSLIGAELPPLGAPLFGLDHTAVGRRAPASQLGDVDVYLAMHVASWLTNWGKHPQLMPAEYRAYFARILPPLLRRAAMAGNNDLLAAIVVGAFGILDGVPGEVWEILDGARDEHGFVSAAAHGDAEPFPAKVHTTLLTVMACALWLSGRE